MRLRQLSGLCHRSPAATSAAASTVREVTQDIMPGQGGGQSTGAATSAPPGSLYITAGLVRRLAAMGLRWSAAHPGRRVLVTVACLAGLASFWALQGQFRGW